VLFDTGLHPDANTTPRDGSGRGSPGFSVSASAGEKSGRARTIDRDPARSTSIINSHFHFDHVGRQRADPERNDACAAPRVEAGMDPDAAARRGFNRRDSISP